MDKKSAKAKHLHHRLHHHFRHKYKHYAAAMAGAAIMSGAMLPGLPVAKAFADTPAKAAPAANKDVEKSRNARYVYYLSSPINFVIHNAALYGFDAQHDSYRLLYLSTRKALVEVTKHDTGKLINVLLERTYNNDWRIIETRNI